MELSQYCISTFLLVLFIGGASIVFAKPILLTLLLAGAFSVFIASRQASLFIVGWLFSIAICAAIYFFWVGQ